MSKQADVLRPAQEEGAGMNIEPSSAVRCCAVKSHMCFSAETEIMI